MIHYNLSPANKHLIKLNFITYFILSFSSLLFYNITMKPRENPFRISALNSLKVHEIHVKD